MIRSITKHTIKVLVRKVFSAKFLQRNCNKFHLKDLLLQETPEQINKSKCSKSGPQTKTTTLIR